MLVYCTVIEPFDDVMQTGRSFVPLETGTVPLSVLHGRLRIRFLGRAAPPVLEDAFRSLGDAPSEMSFVRHVHSTSVLRAHPGDCGSGDGLWTTRRDLALAVSTADCVPIVVSNRKALAVVHAGWRGVAAGIVEEAISALGRTSELRAWLGPSIRGCCFEVEEDVAMQLTKASDDTAVAFSLGPKHKIDLVTAIGVQLRRWGVVVDSETSSCTYCGGGAYWSHRLHGPRAGRNFTFAWLNADDEGSA